ncbi:DNA-3-methyladenine glycosylase family protein [Falsirhodobacter halotolerans]|uniref:DNA-3-methyladenine glycosylase family protein n=1 Tax=Falsirhodobacter halotolerans TaxID=1146892 RepID=UPI001FD08F97|nr:DNA-3-methyladenine glycosylase 2 family protein [Falsirhodobacter halotolerans]MCJ8141171.1 DNA-3-methyladenine glycosylase 2 family protein [Falsirhodobacter halotolerans]
MSPDQIALGCAALAGRHPAFAREVEARGLPPPHGIAPGMGALLRIILGQQVSVASAAACFARLEAVLDVNDPSDVAAAPDEVFRAAGFSRQKIGHARSLADHVASGTLDLTALPRDDDAAVATLTAVKGIGRWTAEIYLLMAEDRADIWPAGDLAVRIGTARILSLPDPRPPEPALRMMAEEWRPWRGVVALMAWHIYLSGPV